MPIPSVTGFTLKETANQTLFIKGSPDTEGIAPLYIGPQNPNNQSMDLLLIGPTAGQMSLYINQGNVFSSGQLTTYVGGAVGFGGDAYQGYAPLFVRGFDGDYDNLQINLYINGPDFEEFNENTSLFIDAGPKTFSSGVLTLYTSGVSSISSPEIQDGSASLYVKNYDLDNNNIDLHIESDFNLGQTADLYINSTLSSGNITLFTDGETISTEDMPLFIKPPFDTDGVQLFVIGYIQN